jgi:hypothetical protein
MGLTAGRARVITRIPSEMRRVSYNRVGGGDDFGVGEAEGAHVGGVDVCGVYFLSFELDVAGGAGVVVEY